jgi:hypothetical protein
MDPTDNTHGAANRVLYSGDPADANIYLLRLGAASQRMDYTDVYNGTVTYTTPPNDEATIAAIPVDSWAGRREKKDLEMENAKHWKRCKDAYAFILTTLDAQTALTVQNEVPDVTDAKGAYDAMMRILNDKGVVTQMNLLVRLLMTIINHDDGTNPLTKMREQTQLATSIAATGCALPDPLLKALILFGLSPDLAHLRTKYIDAEDRPGVPMTLTTLQQRLTTQFQAAAAVDDGIITPANTAITKQSSDSMQQTFTPEVVMALTAMASNLCTHCNKPGHTEDRCWEKHPEKRPNRRTKANRASNNTVPMFMMKSTSHIKGLIVDSGCGITCVPPSTPGLTHLTPAKANHTVEVADGKELAVTHYTTFHTPAQLQDGSVEQWALPMSLVVPGLERPLLATEHLNHLGYTVVLRPSNGPDVSTVLTPTGSIAPLARSGGLPVLPTPGSTDAWLVSSALTTPVAKVSAELQHKRAMHFNKASKGGTNCDVCSATKQRNISHSLVDHTLDDIKVEDFGDLVVSDVAGPFPASMKHKTKYAVSFIDVHTDHLFVYYIRKKSDVQATFKLFVDQCKALKFGTIKRIRTDRGGEYTACKFADYETKTGIYHEWTAPRTPQQNGKAEVTWRTLKSLTRAALYEAELHQSAWERAMATAVFVYNRTDDDGPGTSPYARLRGKEPCRDKWRVFGCLAYPLDKRYTKSLEPTSEVGVFMGYEAAGYKLWIPARQAFLTCPAVKFNEEACTRAARHAAFVKHTKGRTGLQVTTFSEASDLAELDSALGKPSLGNETVNHEAMQQQMAAAPLVAGVPHSPAPTSPTPEFFTPSRSASLPAPPTPRVPSAAPHLNLHAPAIRERMGDARDLGGARASDVGNAGLHRLQQAGIPPRTTRGGTAFTTLSRVADALERDVAEQLLGQPGMDVADMEPQPRERFRFVVGGDSADGDDPPVARAFALTDLEGGLPAAAAAAGCEFAISDSPTVAQALASPDAEKWQTAMDKEVQQLEAMNVWELVDRDSLPPGARVIPGKWVLKKKTKDTGDGTSTHDKYKGRYTARGDQQKKGRDFNTTWSPVVAFCILRILIAFACVCAFPITQVDFDGAYLNAMLDTVVYMEMPFGYGQPHKVCKLLRALYGLKQSGRLWYLTLREWMESYGFVPNPIDPCVFVLHEGASWVVAWVYVDDMGTFSNDEALKERFLLALGLKFTITTLGVLQYYLGINITTYGNTVTLDQRKYIQQICNEHQITPIPVSTPVATTPSADTTTLPEQEATVVRRMMGALVYIAVMTRPDISFAVSAASRHLHNPRVCDRVAIVRIYRYLLCTLHVMLTYSTTNPTMDLYTDSDFDNCAETHRSQSGIVILMFGAAVLWKSVRQAVVALSTTEAEYMAQCMGAQDALYLLYFLEELNITELKQTTPLMLKGDNEGAINMLKEGSDNSRTKHIKRKFAFLKELVRDAVFVAQLIRSQLNFADGLTKGLAKQLQKLSMTRLMGLFFK